MQTISNVLAQKEQQYGRSYVPPKNTVVTDEDKLWEQAKRIVDGLTSDYSEALAKGIDRAVSDGIVSEPELEAREAKSDKAIKTISDLKYWGWLKQNPSGAMNRTSLLVPKKVHGFELELVIYEGKDKTVAWYALFNNKKNVVYKRNLEMKAPF